MFEPVASPPAQPKANPREPIPALIEGLIPLPSVLDLRKQGPLKRLYGSEHLSFCEIDRLVGAS